MEITIEEMRQIILGKVHYKKCPNCDNDGYEYWDENGEGVGPFPRKEWGLDFASGACENCDGLGYIKATLIT